MLVSGLLSPTGPPAWLLELVLAQELACVVDPRILAEYRDVLHRAELKLPRNAVATLLEAIETSAVHVTPRPLPIALPDPDDEPFLACATFSDAVLVTGNARHFPAKARGDTRVWSPRELIDFLRNPS